MINQNFNFTFRSGRLIIDAPERLGETFLEKSAPLTALLENPFSAYLLNKEGNTLLINEFGAEVCGFDSPKHSLGKSLLAVSKKETAETLLQNCHRVLTQKQLQFFDEVNQRKDNSYFECLSIKLPWYRADFTLSGSLGFSIVTGKNNLSASLSKLTSLGLLSLPIPNEKASITPKPFSALTKREKECLDLTLNNFTAKEIAKELGLSHRTVEEYLSNLKRKFKVASKHELIKTLR